MPIYNALFWAYTNFVWSLIYITYTYLYKNMYLVWV